MKPRCAPPWYPPATSGAADMCGLLPCKFWLLVISYPAWALAFAVAFGFVAALVIVGVFQSAPVARLLKQRRGYAR